MCTCARPIRQASQRDVHDDDDDACCSWWVKAACRAPASHTQMTASRRNWDCVDGCMFVCVVRGGVCEAEGGVWFDGGSVDWLVLGEASQLNQQEYSTVHAATAGLTSHLDLGMREEGLDHGPHVCQARHLEDDAVQRAGAINLLCWRSCFV